MLTPTCNDRLIWEICLARYYLPALTVAEQIGLVTFLARSPSTVEEVEAGLSLGLRGAEVLLGLVSALGLLVQRQGRFHLTDEARTYMFTDPCPSNYDGVLLGNIFHSWDRATCLQLAKRCFEILPPSGRIFLHEVLLNDTKDGPLVAAAFSIVVFQMGGRQYTARELDENLREAGFTDVMVNPTYSYYSLVSVRKPVNV
ncbi:MAG: hypothetical protein E6J34_19050 [Chloroflexi bacterium]|nr:MAG: hypothetical protein E6J34_19050 [Chloroflexota bacterium]